MFGSPLDTSVRLYEVVVRAPVRGGGYWLGPRSLESALDFVVGSASVPSAMYSVTQASNRDDVVIWEARVDGQVVATICSIPDPELIIRVMRDRSREEVMHYAGAAHRDPTAFAVVVEYLRSPMSDEPTLRSRGIERHYGEITARHQL